MVAKEAKRRRLRLLREQIRRKAKGGNLLAFAETINKQYRSNWHHQAIAEQIQGFLADPERKRLMLFVPPQHGKSELASVMTPAFCLGMYPDRKIAVASYSADLAGSFSSRVRDIIGEADYQSIFPGIAVTGTTTDFGVIGKRGGMKAVGVKGGLSGRAVDLLIIDDPVKDYIEAASKRTQEVVWNWYTGVADARLHNDSKVILIMTRWHDNDLAGKLLEIEDDENVPEAEKEHWEIIRFPAIKEKGYTHELDPRKVGEALWPERHSLQKLLKQKSRNPSMFESIQQQNPSIEDGNKVKRDWFSYCEEKEVPAGLVRDMWIDGAYTESTKNDPTGIMVDGFHEPTNTLYIFLAMEAYMEITDCLDRVEETAKLMKLGPRSRIRFEPKASGKSMRQLLKKRNRFWQPVEIKGRLVNEGKEARITVFAPKAHAGRVVLVRGGWNKKFLDQLCGYPKAKHDEFVDLAGYSAYHHFDQKKASTYGM